MDANEHQLLCTWLLFCGTLCAPIPVSKNFVRISNREDTNYTNPYEFAKRGKRFPFAHETHELTRIKKSDSREVSRDIEH